jgi:phosphatidylserine/phosphatidylglycerophosphate/cardiolipin synthase-like enzyme
MLLERLGVRVWRYGSRDLKYHAKYLVADDSRTLIGSLNFTRKCFKRTSDFLLLSEDAGLARDLTALFEADRTRQELPRGWSDRVIAGSSGRQRIMQLLEGAHSSIQIVDPKLDDRPLVGFLKARAASGIAVEVLDGPRVGGLRSHGKLLIVDDQMAVVGSFALSRNGVHRKREVAVTVDDPNGVARLRTFFREAAGPSRHESLTCALS